ncbi:hypothetical protein VT84_30910 [Gemmata sp. SH-PL17]|uniref:hypothetical protein n=1 Tax=Gemmata sp. SH-PL17 TaxID=1630693 RepID=UPI00078E7EFF|nr:hypothetical protein [Gemmata sp. SH-PL17]AMV28845.1 hypothetical protein VT84_30910 [Gemmata sp. SH-PL17]
MSGRTVPRFVPVGLLAVALAAPAVAQEGGFQNPRNSDPAPTSRPVAPMPRAKAKRPDLRYFSQFDMPGHGTHTPAPQTNAPRPTKVPNIASHQEGEFPTPTNSDNLLPPAESYAPGFYFVDPFTQRSWRARVAPPPAVLAIGTRGLERVGPGADPHGAAVVVKCKETRVGTLVFGSDIVGSCEGPHDAPLPPCESINWTFPIQNVVKYEYKFEAKAADTASFASAKTNAPANALSGTWYRELPGMVISATFTNDELKLCMAQAADGDTATFTITAHYTLTKDGLVYGAVTGTDADVKRSPTKTNAAQVNADWSEVSAPLQALVDTPFSFRTKMTSSGLMVSGLKCGSPLSRGETDILGGMFKFAKDGRVPAPVPLNTDTSTPDVSLGSALGTAVGAATGKIGPAPQAGPCPAECPRVGIDFNFNPPVMIPPKPIGGACTLPSPVMPPAAVGTPPRPVCNTAVPDTMKSLVSEAFGQMLQRSGGSCVGEGMTLPTPRYLEHYPQYFAPDPAFPLPRELVKEETESAVRRAAATTAAPVIPIASTEPPAKRGVVGTWYRDVAGKQCVVKVSPDHLTLTVHEAVEEDGKVSTASLIFTADYHMARDGVTAVGLVTSVDVSFEGDFPQEDAKPFFEMLGELQKVLEDKPFALTFRPYGDALVIGNVRMPMVSDRMDVQPGGYMAGRYKSAGDKLPKPKPTKMTDPALRQMPGAPTAVPSLAIPPASAYPQPYPQLGSAYPQPYSVPSPAELGRDLLAPQSLPVPRIVPSSGSQPATPSAPQSNPPLMKQPTPPDLSSLEKKKPVPTAMVVGWQNRISVMPDLSHTLRLSPGIVGRMFLFDVSKQEFTKTGGTLTVDLVDETPGKRAAAPERWQFSREDLEKWAIPDKTYEKSYVLFLPWSAYTSDITQVRISARFDADTGHTLFAAPATITIDATATQDPRARSDKPKEMVPVMSQPVKPAMLGVTEVPQQHIGMQELLYQSGTLRQIHNEWRRFWFNDHPSHLTPERIHGGIY